jgi:flagellar biosynthesis component FlhA
VSPTATVSVLLEPGLQEALGARKGEAEEAVEREVCALMAALGIPGDAAVGLGCGAAFTDIALRVTVNGDPCPTPGELLRQTLETTLGQHLPPTASPLTASERVAPELWPTWLATTVRELIKLRPSLLLGEAQAAAHADRVEHAGRAAAPEWLAQASRALLDLWISIADVETIAAVAAREEPEEDATEALIAALRPPSLIVELASPFMREVTEAITPPTERIFPFMRDGLFAELGLPLPPIRLAAAEDLAPRLIALRVNELRSTPELGLPPGKVLANGAAPSLGVEASQATIPSTGYPGALVDAASRPGLEQAGYVTWDPLQHLVLVLAGAVRRYAPMLVDRGIMTERLVLLERFLPALAATAGRQLPLVTLTRLARELLAEHVSIKNLPRILDLALQFRVGRPAGAYGDLTAFVRAGLADQLSAQYASDATDTVVVYLIAPDIEKALSGAWPLDAETQGRVIDAVRAELRYLPETARLPALLTGARVRPRLQELIASELPRLAVLAHDELAPRINVQPVARIAIAD